jgi:pentatricopeptide repeat domain-containing protein 1
MIAQANELELALDVYSQLLREGCTPNLVTYNILIDIHGKMGNWQEAVAVLDALESQVSQPS